jgi:dihydroflavonol-4-reductase
MYRVGIRRSERPAMHAANVTGTERVLDAAIAADVPRIVYVSTIGVFGNTRGRVVDEGYERDPAGGFLSHYDETKYLAHLVAEDRILAGAPVVVVQPGGVYGPGDHSEVGNMIERTAAGRLPIRMFPETGMNFLHVDDAAAGVVLALDRGEPGRAYILGGELARVGSVIDRVAEIAGRRAPRWTLPPTMARMGIPFGAVTARLMGTPPNLREAIAAAHGVTYWATDARARRELGYAPRDLDTGLRQTLAGGPAT